MMHFVSGSAVISVLDGWFGCVGQGLCGVGLSFLFGLYFVRRRCWHCLE